MMDDDSCEDDQQPRIKDMNQIRLFRTDKLNQGVNSKDEVMRL